MNLLNKYKYVPNTELKNQPVYIGRGSKWGNPFVIGTHGTRDQVCDKYEVWFKEQIASGKITQADLKSLIGKDLICFCAPLRCHGQTIIKEVMKLK